jgi:hypothetical protein
MSNAASLDELRARSQPSLAASLNHDLRYDALVSARSRTAAIEIAAEALPAGMQIVHVEAMDVAEQEGRDSWHVAIWFSGRFGRSHG